MSDPPPTVRKRTNISTTSAARWTDEDRTLLWQLRQEQSHLTWAQLYNVVGPRFPGRSKSAITQECQKMEREDAKRRMLLIKEKRNNHTAVSTQCKRPIGDQSDTVEGRLPKEPRLDDHAGEQSSDDGGDIEYDGRSQPSISRQSPNVPHPCENPLHSPSSVQSPALPRPNSIQTRPQPYPSPKGIEAPVSERASRSTQYLPPHTHAPRIRPDGGAASLPSQAPTHTVSSSIPSGNHEANHAVGLAKSAGSALQGNIIPKSSDNEGPHPTSLHYPKLSQQSLHLPPKPPTPQPTPSESAALHPSAQPGEPNKQYIETLTGDQCLDGAVHLLARLTQIRVKEGLAQCEKLNENSALKLRIEELESRLDAQSKQLSAMESIRNAKLLAVEKQMEETRNEMEKMREQSRVTAQRLGEVCRILGILGAATALLDTQGEQSVLPAEAGK
ncbi:hypothetical protein BDV10DRAFT_177697 [Aspergillus recurvatus]